MNENANLDLQAPELALPEVPPTAMNTVVLVLTALAFAAFLTFVAGYARLGTPLIQTMDTNIGEVLFDQGRRFEQAGQYDNAAERYRQALAARFDAPEVRTVVLKRLGTLLWWREGAQAALPYLEEAYAQPDFPPNLYEPLCASLIDVGRLPEAMDVVNRWLSAADQPQRQADAKYYQGKVYAAQGKTDQALEAYVAGDALVPGGRNAYEAGLFWYKAGDFDKALPYLDRYLRGGSGNTAEYARSLRKKIIEAQGAAGRP